jgi:tetratricopeptide (TPR) repeat protein
MLICFGLLAGLPSQADDDGPIFLRWLSPESADDQVIRKYWNKAETGKASANELLDLGTMLFHRGFPKDAVRVYKRALKLDSDLYEAWFRIGLVEHREENYAKAERAYEKCLHLLTGHGWCNFYMGMLQEKTGHPSRAIYHFRRAFKFAPELSDPRVNPEVLYSELYIAGLLRISDRDRFTDYMPMGMVEADKVDRMRSRSGVKPEKKTTKTQPLNKAQTKAKNQAQSKAIPEPRKKPAHKPRTITGKDLSDKTTKPLKEATTPTQDNWSIKAYSKHYEPKTEPKPTPTPKPQTKPKKK